MLILANILKGFQEDTENIYFTPHTMWDDFSTEIKSLQHINRNGLRLHKIKNLSFAFTVMVIRQN